MVSFRFVVCFDTTTTFYRKETFLATQPLMLISPEWRLVKTAVICMFFTGRLCGMRFDEGFRGKGVVVWSTAG
ncbi:MAG TPA: hypothetical protein VMA13_05020, partial [Candidatus Saccharimonadales bacterium]|nr:hypothetical protein [Candidatus Saccharimonadales bacterium]